MAKTEVAEATRRAELAQAKLADAKTEVADAKTEIVVLVKENATLKSDSSDLAGQLMLAQGCLSMRGAIGENSISSLAQHWIFSLPTVV